MLHLGLLPGTVHVYRTVSVQSQFQAAILLDTQDCELFCCETGDSFSRYLTLVFTDFGQIARTLLYMSDEECE